MEARALTSALGGRWCGSYGLAKCPAHDDRNPSLSIMDGEKGLLLKCHASCGFAAVRSALQALGHWPGDQVEGRAARLTPPPKETEFDRERHAAARRIWRESVSIQGTVADCYLTLRGITVSRPPSLRFHPALRHGTSGKDLPALVAAVVDVNGQGRAVQRIYLDPKGIKARVESPKMSLGPVRGCSVRLGPVVEHIGIAEGIETALSVMQLYGIASVWAALGSHGDKLVLPREVRRVTVYGDNGRAGHDIASNAAAAIHRSGRPVDLAFPPPEFPDFNDALVAIDRISA